MKKPEIQLGQITKQINPQQDIPTKKMTREQFDRHIRKLRDRDAEMVTGIFKNLENPASAGSKGALCFGYKAYPGDDFTFYELHDGERYRIPRGVARHLNTSCYYKEYQHLPGEYGQQGMRGAMDPEGKLKQHHFQMARKVYRYAFHSLEYMDDDTEMNKADITEVTVSP